MSLSVYVGAVFGNLTVLSETEKRVRGAKIWQCSCKCGNLVNVKTDYLQQNWTKSCGCLRISTARDRIASVRNLRNLEDVSVYKLKTLIRNMKNGAKKRGLDFLLTDDQVYTLVSKSCHYCGYIPSKQNNSSISYSDVYVGVDRKDNNLGYTFDNSVACCKICNRAKRDMSYLDFLGYIDRIRGLNGTTR